MIYVNMNMNIYINITYIKKYNNKKYNIFKSIASIKSLLPGNNSPNSFFWVINELSCYQLFQLNRFIGHPELVYKLT